MKSVIAELVIESTLLRECTRRMEDGKAQPGCGQSLETYPAGLSGTLLMNHFPR